MFLESTGVCFDMKMYLKNVQIGIKYVWWFCVINIIIIYVLMFNSYVQFVNLLPSPTVFANTTYTIFASAFNKSSFTRTHFSKDEFHVSFSSQFNKNGSVQRFDESSYITHTTNNTSTSSDNQLPYSLTYSFTQHSNKYYTSRILNRQLAEISPVYSNAMTSKERRSLQDILLKCKSELDKVGINYFMYSGTLLGSYRHHDIIPWDDDVDIIVDFTQRQLLLSTLNHLRPFFFLDVHTSVRWKFYSIKSRPIKTMPWSWPFLDISFYHENGTHLWDSDDIFKKYYVYKKSDVFPLINRPFMGLLLPAPKATEVILKFYKIGMCRSVSYSHRKEIEIKHVYNVNCVLLNTRYPMVTRLRLSNGVNETLGFKGKIISWFFIPNS